MNELLLTVRATLDEWMRIRWSDLQFAEARAALLLFVVLLATTLLVLLARGIRTGGRRALVTLPAIVPGMRWSPAAAVRHVPLLLFLAGVPLFAVALADPRTGFAQEEVSYPGRRIALLVDASTSMVLKFDSAKLNKQGESTFYTAVAA
ncbi:MAG TPA: hypothetical protein VNN99_06825, partial [Vicinamibacterales bacterium]|nr:hypothetical protein [Vicinamibacterales bacterium]